MCAHLQDYFGAKKTYITDYKSVFQKALNGKALDVFNEARSKCALCLDY